MHRIASRTDAPARRRPPAWLAVVLAITACLLTLFGAPRAADAAIAAPFTRAVAACASAHATTSRPKPEPSVDADAHAPKVARPHAQTTPSIVDPPSRLVGLGAVTPWSLAEAQRARALSVACAARERPSLRRCQARLMVFLN